MKNKLVGILLPLLIIINCSITGQTQYEWHQDGVIIFQLKTDQFLDMYPIFKEGVLNGKNIEMRQISVEYSYQECIQEMYDVPGYSEQCNWYHRAHVTSLGITDNVGERFEIFRGLNHSYIVKPGDTVTSFWTIIRSD